MSDKASADWSDIEFLPRSGKLYTTDDITVFSELGRRIVAESAFSLQGQINQLAQVCLDTALLTRGAGARLKVRRLLRPMRVTIERRLPNIQKDFAQFPARFEQIFAEELGLSGRPARGFDMRAGGGR